MGKVPPHRRELAHTGVPFACVCVCNDDGDGEADDDALCRIAKPNAHARMPHKVRILIVCPQVDDNRVREGRRGTLHNVKYSQTLQSAASVRSRCGVCRPALSIEMFMFLL